MSAEKEETGILMRNHNGPLTASLAVRAWANRGGLSVYSVKFKHSAASCIL